MVVMTIFYKLSFDWDMYRRERIVVSIIEKLRGARRKRSGHHVYYSINTYSTVALIATTSPDCVHSIYVVADLIPV